MNGADESPVLPNGVSRSVSKDSATAPQPEHEQKRHQPDSNVSAPEDNVDPNLEPDRRRDRAALQAHKDLIMAQLAAVEAQIAKLDG